MRAKHINKKIQLRFSNATTVPIFLDIHGKKKRDITLEPNDLYMLEIETDVVTLVITSHGLQIRDEGKPIIVTRISVPSTEYEKMRLKMANEVTQKIKEALKSPKQSKIKALIK